MSDELGAWMFQIVLCLSRECGIFFDFGDLTEVRKLSQTYGQRKLHKYFNSHTYSQRPRL